MHEDVLVRLMLHADELILAVTVGLMFVCLHLKSKGLDTQLSLVLWMPDNL